MQLIKFPIISAVQRKGLRLVVSVLPSPTYTDALIFAYQENGSLPWSLKIFHPVNRGSMVHAIYMKNFHLLTGRPVSLN